MGPLAGIRVLEIGGIGPGPFAAMMLADMGADVLRIDRFEVAEPGIVSGIDPRYRTATRSRRSAMVDLKNSAGIETVLRLAKAADVLIEGFRPGTMERLGLGPEPCRSTNPRLVYGRITGWGQDGPLATRAGHDINYLALAGALHAIGQKDGPPVPPLNLIGDYGGGGMYLAFGVVCALVERARSGKGQVVDAAMIDGIASLMGAVAGLQAAGAWREERGVNALDGGAPWYGTYKTKDDEYVALGAIEPRFLKEFMRRVGLSSEALPTRDDRAAWPRLRERFEALFLSKTREEWDRLLATSDACVTPVLSLSEAQAHPHVRARQMYVVVDGVPQPAPAPRFSRSVPAPPTRPPIPGEHTESALLEWGLSDADVQALRACGAIPPAR